MFNCIPMLSVTLYDRLVSIFNKLVSTLFSFQYFYLYCKHIENIYMSDPLFMISLALF